jgi:hypothetical protein
MDKESKDKLKGTLIVPIGLTIILIPFSILIGWNVISLILFWFVLTPGLTIYLPTKLSRSKNHFIESLLGLVIFYAIMVLLIYDHYKTDYFQIMILSFVINLTLVLIFAWTKKHKTLAQ